MYSVLRTPYSVHVPAQNSNPNHRHVVGLARCLAYLLATAAGLSPDLFISSFGVLLYFCKATAATRDVGRWFDRGAESEPEAEPVLDGLSISRNQRGRLLLHTSTRNLVVCHFCKPLSHEDVRIRDPKPFGVLAALKPTSTETFSGLGGLLGWASLETMNRHSPAGTMPLRTASYEQVHYSSRSVCSLGLASRGPLWEGLWEGQLC
ncbi:hypothetical protein V8C37DRAFT_366757 [Trichoderma ceciliae]